MINFLNNGGIELICGTTALIAALIWSAVDKKKVSKTVK